MGSEGRPRKRMTVSELERKTVTTAEPIPIPSAQNRYQFMRTDQDCLKAALVSLLGVPYDEAPDWPVERESRDLMAWVRCARALGLELRFHEPCPPRCTHEACDLPVRSGRWVVTLFGVGPDRLSHSVVMNGDQLEHDPLPLDDPDYEECRRIVGELLATFQRSEPSQFDRLSPETFDAFLGGVSVRRSEDVVSQSPSDSYRYSDGSLVSRRGGVNKRLLTTDDLATTPPPLNRQVFTANGTWTKPTPPSGAAAYTEVVVELIGGGGGGGSGRKGAAASERYGGGGGGGGSYSRTVYPLAALGATEAVVVGAGGSGGAAVAVDSTNGNNGADGAESSFGSGATLVVASPGKAGARGTNTSAAGGVLQFHNALIGGQDGGAGSNGTGLAPTGAAGYTRGGGGAGGINAADAVGNGAAAGGVGPLSVAAGAAGTGGAAGGNGGAVPTNTLGGGGGGGGGGASSTANAGAGGNAGTYGSGGGGGGASLNAVGNSGAGGNGANGIVIVTTR